MRSRTILAASLAVVAYAPAGAAITQVSYASITASQTVAFAGQPLGTRNEVIFGSGVAFGERFAGQMVTQNGVFDALSGMPDAPLIVIAGPAGQNLSLLGPVVAGIYTDPLSSSVQGTGAVSLAFSTGQSQFAFSVFGADNGGTVTASFFGSNGGLLGLQTVPLSMFGTADFGFMSDTNDIFGISLTNTDRGGIGYGDIRYNVASNLVAVPEPTTWAMMIFGFGAIGAATRKRRRPNLA